MEVERRIELSASGESLIYLEKLKLPERGWTQIIDAQISQRYWESFQKKLKRKH